MITKKNGAKSNVGLRLYDKINTLLWQIHETVSRSKWKDSGDNVLDMKWFIFSVVESF